MNQELQRLSHEIYDLLSKLEGHVPEADAVGKRLLYETKKKPTEVSALSQRIT